jgi:hypothetical protein
MESIAFIWGRYMVYWSTAIVTMACGVGMLLFLFLYLWDEEDYLGGFWALECWGPDWPTGISGGTPMKAWPQP